MNRPSPLGMKTSYSSFEKLIAFRSIALGVCLSPQKFFLIIGVVEAANRSFAYRPLTYFLRLSASTKAHPGFSGSTSALGTCARRV